MATVPFQSKFREGATEMAYDLDQRVNEIMKVQAEIKETQAKIEGQLNTFFMLFNQMEKSAKTCREQCEANKKAVWDTIAGLTKFNPVWIYAIGMTILAIIGIINLFVQLKGAHP